MLIRKCGLDAVRAVMPEEHMKLLTNIRKVCQNIFFRVQYFQGLTSEVFSFNLWQCRSRNGRRGNLQLILTKIILGSQKQLHPGSFLLISQYYKCMFFFIKCRENFSYILRFKILTSSFFGSGNLTLVACQVVNLHNSVRLSMF